jgi:bifunctional non-homologous end joining protein LigD
VTAPPRGAVRFATHAPFFTAKQRRRKWDGFRAIVSTDDGLRVRSRRGWNMTGLLPELEALPEGLVLDGELVAFEDGLPFFPLLCERMLHGRRHVPVVCMIFDVLRVDCVSTMGQRYTERRAILEALDLSGPSWHTPCAFDDGAALLAATSERSLEGIVAKRADAPYRPGERGWVKVKHREYWRSGEEREFARRRSVV